MTGDWRLEEMIMFPLAPSAIWYSLYLRGLNLNLKPEEAAEQANRSLKSAKDFSRFQILDANLHPLTLSVAIEGGARQLRVPDKIPELLLSEHGNWRKIHLGALESVLGKKPFYRYLETPLREIYMNEELGSLRDFNAAIFGMLDSFLMKKIPIVALTSFSENKVLKERGREIAGEISPECSILQAIAIHGKEALLGILALGID